MATPPKKITPTRLAEVRDEEEFWRRKSAAAALKAEALSLDPSLADSSTSSRVRGRSLSDSYKENYEEGLKIKGFREGLGDSVSSKPAPVSPELILDRKARIAASLAGMKYSPDEIKKYLDAISPFLDSTSLAGDPWANRYMMEKFQGGQNPTRNDIIEAVRLGSEMNRTHQPSDPASMISAMTQVFKAAQDSRNTVDPVASFNSGINTVLPLFQQMSETQKTAFQAQIESLRNELAEKDPAVFFDRMRSFAETMGWHPSGSEDPTVLLHRLDSADKQSERAFQIEREKWKAEFDAKTEGLKERKQTEMLKTVVGTVQKALESPVVREFGKTVGRSIGVPTNPLSDAKTAAAKQTLENPMEEKFSLTCSTCKRISYFSRSDLLKIEQSAGGKWVCPCGAAYGLKNSSSGTDDKNKDEGSPIV